MPRSEGAPRGLGPPAPLASLSPRGAPEARVAMRASLRCWGNTFVSPRRCGISVCVVWCVRCVCACVRFWVSVGWRARGGTPIYFLACLSQSPPFEFGDRGSLKEEEEEREDLFFFFFFFLNEVLLTERQ